VDPKVAKALVVSNVLVADGMMTDEERAFLDDFITTLGLDDEQRRAVIDLEGADDAAAVVHQLSEDERRDIVGLLVDACASDGKLSPHELDVVKRLTAALGL
jgi:uncharacterized tellurite resistance protein B-like protein